MGTSLYNLTGEYLQASEKLADLELPDEVVNDTLEGLRFPIEQKAINVAMFAQNLEANAAAIKEAEGRMAARREAIENRAKRIREYLKYNMETSGISKIESPYFKISIQDNPPSVVIDSESQIPSEYMRTPTPPPPAPDKKLIGDALKAGKEFSWAHLNRTKRLVIK